MNTQTDNTKKERHTILGVIFTAIMASVCCVGPLILLCFGIGGAWVGNLTAFEPLRPYLIIVTLSILGYVFYKTYSRPNAENCEPGSYCANPKSEKINKVTLWISTIFVFGLLSSPYIVEGFISGENTIADGPYKSVKLKEVTLDVPGMNCASCPFTVQKSLKKLDGVVSAKATLENKKAVVKYDPLKVTPKQMIEATKNAGYPSNPE
ncbi:MAG: hypothetical protein D8M58_03305 [Calditrichaeota bacterium]|nr:MAG: hypothetical protein DWQ03_03770 [Calditrichota bacterium]MBL1204393.1 hypothetical protein [Calditrichota bacterium]NOG44222.1 hypothetical protein [Calditrichota bacterium]